MAALIRFPDETDAEYERRTRPLLAETHRAMAPFYAKQIRKLYENNEIFSGHLRLAHKLGELRRSAGVKDTGTFRWDVYNELP